MMYLIAKSTSFKPFRFLGLDFPELEEDWAVSPGEVPSQFRREILDNTIGSNLVHLTENSCALVLLCWPESEIFLRNVGLCQWDFWGIFLCRLVLEIAG